MNKQIIKEFSLILKGKRIFALLLKSTSINLVIKKNLVTKCFFLLNQNNNKNKIKLMIIGSIDNTPFQFI